MITLSITGKPVITYDKKYSATIVSKVGSKLKIPVNVTGNPKPTVAWFYGEESLETLTDFSVETKNGSSTLTGSGLSAKHSGTYKVKAENKVGIDEATFDVTIKG